MGWWAVSRPRGGCAYRDAVLVVHSKGVKAKDEAIELSRLQHVEHPNSPIRIVISVQMLKEGWDVRNVYVLLSTQPSLSDVLTEQVLGRGLRLPFGKYTGVEMLDTLEVLAHDRYEDLLKRRNVFSEQFIDHKIRSLLRTDSQGNTVVVRETETVENPVIPAPEPPNDHAPDPEVDLPTDPSQPTDTYADREVVTDTSGTPTLSTIETRDTYGQQQSHRLAAGLSSCLCKRSRG